MTPQGTPETVKAALARARAALHKVAEADCTEYGFPWAVATDADRMEQIGDAIQEFAGQERDAIDAALKGDENQ